MTDYQIERAAILWKKRKNTLEIANEVCPQYKDVRGYIRGGESDVYNHLSKIKAKAAEDLY